MNIENNSIFLMDANEFIDHIRGIVPEYIEDYYSNEKVAPNDEEILSAIEILSVIFKFVKSLQPCFHSLKVMAKYLKLMAEHRETMFLFETIPDKYIPPIFKDIKDDGAKSEIYIATGLFDYYIRAFGFMDYVECSVLLRDTLSGKEIVGGCFRQTTIKNNKQIIDKNTQFPINLKGYLDEYVVGQEELKKTLSMAVYHYLLGEKVDPILVIGDTGTGKNHSINVLQTFPAIQSADIPFLTFDVSKLSLNGFQGVQISHIIEQFKKKAVSSKYKLKKGILYLDEIDKCVIPNHDSTGENMNMLLQLQMLSLLSGTTIADVDTSDLLIILGGAFSDLTKLRSSKQRNQLGFCSSDYKITNDTLRDELIEIGMEREFLSRISYIVQMHKLDKQQLKAILVHEKIGPIARLRRQYENDGLSLIIDDEVFDLIVRKAAEENLGARSVSNIVLDLCSNYNYDMIKNGYQTLHVHKGMILKNESPIFERGEGKVLAG